MMELMCIVQNIYLTVSSMPNCGGFWSSHTWCKHARDSRQFKVAESKLVEVLGRLEEDDPTVLVEALSILGRAQGGTEETQLDINIELSALWRPE